MEKGKMNKTKKRVLHLTIKRRWFEEIAAGRKREEYRKSAPHYWRRLWNRIYDEIWFYNARCFSKDAPFMRVEWKGCQFSHYRNSYIIHLGKVLEVRR